MEKINQKQDVPSTRAVIHNKKEDFQKLARRKFTKTEFVLKLYQQAGKDQKTDQQKERSSQTNKKNGGIVIREPCILQREVVKEVS